MAGRDFSSRRLRLGRFDFTSLIRKLLPAPGSAFFTLLVVGVVLFAQGAGAWPLGDTAATNTLPSMISYQGRLADTDGNPLSGDYQMRFALYDVPAGGSACWSETQTASVSDGLFNVLLGSVNDIDPSCLEGDVYLGIKVGSDSEMTPRELLTSVPFARQADEVIGLVKGRYGGGKTAGGSSFTEQYHVGSLKYSSGADYDKLFVTVWGGYWGNNTLGKDFYSISSRGGLKVTRTRLFGTTGGYSLKIYDNGTNYDVVVEVGPNWPNVLIRSQKLAGPDAILEQEVTPGYDPTGKTDVTPTIENHIVTDNNGNVGIGTTDPTAKLSVGMTGSSSAAQVGYNTSNMVELGWDGYPYIQAQDSHAPNGYGLVLNPSGGNVGIGTTSPQSKLDVAGGVDIRGGLNMHGNSIADLSSSFKAPNADKLDGKDSSDFADSSHNHDSRYYNVGGDTMGGTLDMGGHNIQSIGTIHPGGNAVDIAGRLNVTNDSTSEIEGNLKVGNNSWTPSFAGMDGNDMAVEGQFEQKGTGGARMYKVGVGTDPDNDAGTLAVSQHVRIGNQGTISAKKDSGNQGAHMVFETDDCFTFQNENGMRLRICGNQYGVSYEGNTWHYFNDTIVPGQDNSYDLGGAGNRRWRSIYVNNAYCGALVESNMQTAEELASERIDRFAEGDLQCWSPATQRLEKCATVNDPLVQSVADTEGRPIVIGAELIKVIGPVQPGDLLVSSDVPGYAMVNNYPMPGTVIAQALEEFCGEKGIIKAMIRKF